MPIILDDATPVVSGSFVPRDWKNFPDTTTPLTAEAIEDQETRLSTYTDSRVASQIGSFDTRLTTIEANAALTSATAADKHYLGNATQSEFDGEPNIPIQVKTYHGNAGGFPVSGRPQGIQIISKYFAPTPTDSAQAGSSGAFLVNTGTPFTQTLPLTGMEGDAVVQGANVLTNKAVGVSGSAEAQDTAHITKAICLYAADKSASAVGAIIDEWYGVYVETPNVVGTVTDKIGVYSRPRIQTETGLVVGVTEANLTASQKGQTVVIAGTNAVGQPAVKISKKSGSTDDLVQFADSGGQARIIINQDNQMIFKTGGTNHSVGGSVGPMIALGNIGTAPNANYTGGLGGFLYVESGALKFRGGAGTITPIANA